MYVTISCRLTALCQAIPIVIECLEGCSCSGERPSPRFGDRDKKHSSHNSPRHPQPQSDRRSFAQRVAPWCRPREPNQVTRYSIPHEGSGPRSGSRQFDQETTDCLQGSPASAFRAACCFVIVLQTLAHRQLADRMLSCRDEGCI